MRQRLARARRVLREKYPRTHKIIDKTTDMVGWTPIILMIYSQVILMTYSLYKSEGNKRDG